jgi:hypothetical protein
LAAAVNDQFAKDFSVAFRQKLINGMKLSCIENNINKTSLMQYDNPAQHLKTGFLVKMGGNVKSWKKRFVVACNKSDNYNIIYYENETMKKEKGRFCCCGYVVNSYYLIAACLLFFSTNHLLSFVLRLYIGIKWRPLRLMRQRGMESLESS